MPEGAGPVQQTVVGDRCVVAGRDAHVTVYAGTKELKLPLRLDRPTLDPGHFDPDHLTVLLQPYNPFLPLLGREREWERLLAWRDAAQCFRWLALTGEGGIGKTRLALEFARETRAGHWLAGFVESKSLEHLVADPGFWDWEPDVDTLLVIDYAASKTTPLADLLLRLAAWAQDAPPGEGPRVRLLLLERQASPRDGWLAQLAECGEGATVQFLRDTLDVEELFAPTTTSREEAVGSQLQAAFAAWAELTGNPTSWAHTLADDDLALLLRHTEGRPLFIQLAALQACLTGDASCLSRWNQQALLDFAVEREREYVRRETGSPEVAWVTERAVALLTLVGPRNPDDDGWLALLREEASARGYALSPGQVRDRLEQILAMKADTGDVVLRPLAPDLLAEAFAARILGDKPVLAQPSLERALDLADLDGWRRLLALVADLDRLVGGEARREWLARLAQAWPPADLARVEPLVPSHSAALADFALECAEAAVDSCPEEASEEETAPLLEALANRYRDLGWWEDALSVSEEAVEAYERLAEEHADIYTPKLASSLNTLGLCLASLRQRKEALAATERAVDLYLSLSEDSLGLYDASLAVTLMNLGNCYSSVARREDALTATQRAVALCERLAQERPDVFDEVLAASLVNLGTCLGRLGLSQESAGAVERAVRIRQRLARERPDLFEGSLAASLNSLAISYSKLGRHREALEAAERAVELCEGEAQRLPDLHQPNLARCLRTLALAYADLQRDQEALTTTERAVQLWEHLVEQCPGLYEVDLARGLTDLGVRCGEGGRPEEALSTTERAVKLYEQLVEDSPGLYEAELATSLSNFALWQSKLDHWMESLRPRLRVVRICEGLACEYPDIYEDKFAQSLSNLAYCCLRLGHPKDALDAQRRAVEVYETAAHKFPDLYDAKLAGSLNYLGCLHHCADQKEEALVAFQRAVAMYERLTTEHPDRYQSELDTGLKNLEAACAEKDPA